MSEWQPIETAPKDGTIILAKRSYSENGIKVYYDDPEWYDLIGRIDPYLRAEGFIADDEWCGFYDLNGQGPWLHITHWMPLPSPPKVPA